MSCSRYLAAVRREGEKSDSGPQRALVFLARRRNARGFRLQDRKLRCGARRFCLLLFRLLLLAVAFLLTLGHLSSPQLGVLRVILRQMNGVSQTG